jgi:hypothetical protein
VFNKADQVTVSRKAEPMAKMNKARELARKNMAPVILGDIDKRLKTELDKPRGISFWTPKVAGDTITGKVIERKDGMVSKFKGHATYSVLTVINCAGTFRIDCGAAVLARFVDENKIKKGSVVAVKFTGYYIAKESGRKVKGFSTACI